MPRFNPVFSGLLIIRRFGLATGAWFLADNLTFAASSFAPPPASGVGIYASGIAWGAALLAFFLPRVNQGQIPLQLSAPED